MSFGDGIRSLLDTYANCISLIKAFGRGREEAQQSGPVITQNERSRLRKSLRSDRSLVERTYSSRLSESGSRLSKGDARAVTAVDRILKRLRKAITGLLRLSSTKDGLDLDYESLMSLSNASRTDAIKAIDSLSRRLASPSRSSVASASTKASSKTSSKASSSRRKRKSSSKSGAPTSKPSREARKGHSPSERPVVAVERDKGKPRERKPGAERRHKSPPPESMPPPPKTLHKEPQMRISRAKSPSLKSLNTTAPNRVSILSFSSDSTKLGEIPQSKWQSVMHYSVTDSDADEYNVRPMFPLKPYTVEVRERRFFGLFSRRREA